MYKWLNLLSGRVKRLLQVTDALVLVNAKKPYHLAIQEFLKDHNIDFEVSIDQI